MATFVEVSFNIDKGERFMCDRSEQFKLPAQTIIPLENLAGSSIPRMHELTDQIIAGALGRRFGWALRG